MRYVLLFLLALLPAAAAAQQVPNPMPITGGPQVTPRFGYLHLESPLRAFDDLTDMYLFRDANYSGGTHGLVNTLASFNTTVRAATIPHEWNLFAGLENYGTMAVGGENVALYVAGVKHSTGFTWGAVSQVTDYNTIAPSKGAIALELNLTATGADVSGNRTALNIYNNVTPGGVEPVNMRSDIQLDGVFVIRGNAIEANGNSGTGTNYWFNLLNTSGGAPYLYGINLSEGACDNSIVGTPGAQFVGPNFTVDCFGTVTVAASQPINIKASGTNQGWLRLVSSTGSNFIESGLNSTGGSEADLVFSSLNVTKTYLLTGPTGTMIGSGTKQGIGTLNVQTGYYVGGAAGVTCAAGTFVAATAVVTKGIVTKCN